MKLRLEFFDSGSIRAFDRLRRIVTARDALKKSFELILSTAIAEHQVMHERPRLAVKNPLLVSFVVVRRVSTDRKECFQRQHFHLTQQVKVTDFGHADEDVTTREL